MTRVRVRRGHGVMGDHHDRVAVGVDDLAQEREHVAPGAPVERSGRLVGEHDLGPGDERAGDRDALLLAAGELRGTVAQAVLEPDPRRDLAHGRAPRAAAVQPQRQADVLRDRERGQQVEGLEHEPDPLAPQDRQPPLAEPRQVGVAERDGAGGGPVEPRRDVEERALAGARRAHDRGERPSRELDADAVEGDDGAVALAMDLADVAKGDRGSGGGSVGERSASWCVVDMARPLSRPRRGRSHPACLRPARPRAGAAWGGQPYRARPRALD